MSSATLPPPTVPGEAKYIPPGTKLRYPDVLEQ
jgi:hypothetical protein